MKYINDLAYSNHIAQTKNLAKDKRQKNKYRQTALVKKDQNSDNASEEQVQSLMAVEKEDDRRNGDDRRITQQDRGRYVESRLKKNRRYKKEFSLVI